MAATNEGRKPLNPTITTNNEEVTTMFYFAVSEIATLNGGKPFDSMAEALDWIIDAAISHEMTFMPELSDENTLWFRDRYGWLQWSKVIEVKL